MGSQHRSRTVFAAPVTLAISALVISGCAAANDAQTRSSPMLGTGASVAEARNQQNSTPLTVRETEFTIALNASLAPGMYVFEVENAGNIVHDLVISGPEVNSISTPRIDSGGSAELTVNLAPGVYDVWCSVENHRALGMATTITVG